MPKSKFLNLFHAMRKKNYYKNSYYKIRFKYVATMENKQQKQSYVLMMKQNGSQQSLTRLVLLLVRIRTGIPSNWGSTGWRKGRDSGSWRYKDSKVGMRAWRSSSGLKTGKEGAIKRLKWGGLLEQGTRDLSSAVQNGRQQKVPVIKHS